jgi:hypothetical protein
MGALTSLFSPPGTSGYRAPTVAAQAPEQPAATPAPDFATTQQSSADTQQRQRAAAALAAGRGDTILGGSFVKQPGQRKLLGES